MKPEETTFAAPLTYLFGGIALGAVCGLLFAPKKGSELRQDINEWGRRSRVRGQELLAQVREYLPNKEKPEGMRAHRGGKERIDEPLAS